MVEPMFFRSSIDQPYLTRRFEQTVGAHDIGLDKGIRAVDGPVDMRLGGKMHDRIDAFLTQQVLDPFAVADITVDESEARS